jgi:hypothetical protein
LESEDFNILLDPLYSDFIELSFTTTEAPILDNSNTAPDAGLEDIADKFPPRAPNAPDIDIYREFPLSFSRLQFTTSFKFWEFREIEIKISKKKVLIKII